MKLSYRRTILSLIPAVVATAVHAPPASALGRSSAPSSQSPAVQPIDRLSRVEAKQKSTATALQAQIEALRQELEALKTRVELQDMASAE